MQELLHHPSWESYARQMEDEENRGIQSLVTCSKDEHDYWKGYITALRWAYHRPQKVIDLAEKEYARNGIK
jgi:hypothetical protein